MGTVSATASETSLSPWNEIPNAVQGPWVVPLEYSLTQAGLSKKPHKTPRWRLLQHFKLPCNKDRPCLCRMQSLFEGWSKTVKWISPEAKRETQSSPSSTPGVWCFFDHFFQTWNQVYLKTYTKASQQNPTKRRHSTTHYFSIDRMKGQKLKLLN